MTTNEELQRIGFMPFDTARYTFTHPQTMSEIDATTTRQDEEGPQECPLTEGVGYFV